VRQAPLGGKCRASSSTNSPLGVTKDSPASGPDIRVHLNQFVHKYSRRPTNPHILSSVRVAQESARGTLILFAGNLAYTAITAVAGIFIARLLGPNGYGLYTLTFVVPSILLLFVGLGVNTAVTRYVAYYISSGDVERAKSLTRTATSFLLLFGLLLSAVNFFGSSYFVDILLHRPQLIPYVQVASLFIIGQTITQSSTSVFIGWGSMTKLSAFTVLQAVLKLVLTVGLILAGFGVLGAVVGHLLSYLVEGALATLFLYLAHMRPWSRQSNTFLADTRMMVGYGFPLFAGSIVSGLASQYVTIILAAIATNAVIGYYQAAQNVTIAISVLSGAATNALFRSFAALDGLSGDTSLAFSYAVRYVSLVLTPIVFLLIAAAGPLFNILYGPSYSQGVVLLQLVALSLLPVSIGLTVLSSFLNGIGKSRITMFVTLASAVALAVAALFFGVSLGLGADGIMLAFLVSNLTLTVPGLVIARRYLGVRLFLKPLAGIVVAAFIAWLAISILPLGGLPSIVGLTIDCILYTIVYLTCAPLVWGIDADDIVRLSIAVETLGPVRKILNLILMYEKGILTLVKRG
jgi:stage V sporulation protein B